MTSQEKRIKGMDNKELLETLLLVVERNVAKAANKGYTTIKDEKYENNLRAEAYARFCKE